MSKGIIIIADETKCSEKLGTHPLPIEIIPFAAKAIEGHLKERGYLAKWRKNSKGSKYLTDNHNWILDITFSKPLDNPEKIHLDLINIPGVVDTGFFFNLASCSSCASIPILIASAVPAMGDILPFMSVYLYPLGRRSDHIVRITSIPTI